MQLLRTKFPWLNTSMQGVVACSQTADDAPPLSPPHCSSAKVRRRLNREDRLFAELSVSKAKIMSQGLVTTGFLLKRDSHDSHVWRRVHCVFSADDLWCVSRIYDAPSPPRTITTTMTTLATDQQQPACVEKYRYCYAKHGRIRLTRGPAPRIDYGLRAPVPCTKRRTPLSWYRSEGRRGSFARTANPCKSLANAMDLVPVRTRYPIVREQFVAA